MSTDNNITGTLYSMLEKGSLCALLENAHKRLDRRDACISEQAATITRRDERIAAQVATIKRVTAERDEARNASNILETNTAALKLNCDEWKARANKAEDTLREIMRIVRSD